MRGVVKKRVVLKSRRVAVLYRAQWGKLEIRRTRNRCRAVWQKPLKREATSSGVYIVLLIYIQIFWECQFKKYSISNTSKAFFLCNLRTNILGMSDTKLSYLKLDIIKKVDSKSLLFIDKLIIQSIHIIVICIISRFTKVIRRYYFFF